MNVPDILGLAANGIRSRKLRSGLTALGVIIGSAAFVALVSLGKTVEASVLDQIGDLGTERIQVTPGVTEIFAEGPPDPLTQAPDEKFTLADEAALRATKDIVAATGTYQDRIAVAYRGDNARILVQGIDPEPWRRVTEPDLVEGRFLSGGGGNNAMVSEGLLGLFDNPLAINNQFTLEGKSYRVVGVLAGSEEQTIYIHREQAWDLLGIEDGTLSRIVALRTPDSDPDVVSAAVEASLLRSRGLNPDDRDFTVTTSQDILREVASLTATIQAFLGTIAGISLLVGGIGIANTMFMTVMERAKQIGILKAVGMTRREIAVLFLAESGLIGLMGGIIGAVLGGLGAFFLSPPVDDTIKATPDVGTMVGMVVFAVVIGSIAGLIPALRAATVPPMESLQGP